MNKIMSSPEGDDDRQKIGENEYGGAEQSAPPAEGHPVDKNEPASEENNSNQNGEVTPESRDIFDDLETLGRRFDDIVPSERVLTSLPMRKPKRDEWVRCHPTLHTPASIYEAQDGSSRSMYIIMPSVVEPILDVVRYVRLCLATNYNGTPFVWPVPVPTDRKAHRAHLTAQAAGDLATREWVRISWGDGEYGVHRRKSAKLEPMWPGEITSAAEMLRFAAKAGEFEVIDSIDHPVVRGLLGHD